MKLLYNPYTSGVNHGERGGRVNIGHIRKRMSGNKIMIYIYNYTICMYAY